MQKVKGIKLACLAAFAILPVHAYALGIGKLTMNSALDEPLNATIELTAATETELQTLEVTLGSAGVFKMAGIERSEQLKAIDFSLAKVNGKNIIRLKTEQPFRDPFLHLIINASWANGSTLREYTALLDPPSYLAGAPAIVQAPVVTKAADVKPAPASVTTTTVATGTSVQTKTADTQKLGPDVAGSETYSDLRPGSTYGPVKKGDVLWNIADDVRAGTDYANNQIMVAIFLQNPDAFMQNNINLIRVGKTLKIPSNEEISAISRSAAEKEMRVQMEEWQRYKDGLAGSRRIASAEASDVSSQTAVSAVKGADADAEKTDSSGEAKAAESVSAGETDVLEIVRAKVDGAEPSGTGASIKDSASYESEIAAYKENISMLEESLASSELERKELSDRIVLLEEQIDKANKLIDLQNTDLARMQSQGQQAGVTVTPQEAVPETAMLGPDISPIQPVAPKAQKPQVAATTEVVKKPPVSEKKAATTRVRAEPTEEKGMLGSIVDAVTSSWITMMGAGLALLLVVVGLFVVLRRRRSIAEFEDSIISGTAVLDISTAESTQPAASTSETSFLSDFVPGMGNMQADEVDPLAEAEVYMAYGRDEQAEEVLKEAVSKNPDRHELKLKLLEIYQGRKDVSSFETLAEELYPADGNVPMDVWSKVAEMGKIVNPDNPLFQGDIKIQEDTLFGDKDRKEDVELSELLDADTVDNEDITAGDTEELIEQAEEEITEEMFSGTDTSDLEAMEGLGLDEDTQEIPEQRLAGEENIENIDSKNKADDFPVPDEEVLDLDLGDFTPDEAHETDTLDLDSINLDLEELEEGAEESEEIEEAKIDLNLEGIDLDMDDTSEDLESKLEGIEDIDLDLGSEESRKDVNIEDSRIETDTAETSLQDETLEFADLGDLTLADADIDSGIAEAELGAGEGSSEMPESANETWDEAGTKLDLARAYMEMDDKESAQSILEEVAKEGTDDQKNEARDLISQLN